MSLLACLYLSTFIQIEEKEGMTFSQRYTLKKLVKSMFFQNLSLDFMDIFLV
jgi:hypothetical protein